MTRTAAKPKPRHVEAAPPEERRGPRVRPMAVVGALGGIVTLVSGVLGLVFVLLPQLKPSPPPAHQAVHLSQTSFDRHVTFGQYLKRQALPAGDLDAATLRQRGALLTIHYDIMGYKGKRLPLRWQLLDLRRGDQVGQEQAITITGTADQDEGDWLVWVPEPPRSGRYAIDVSLLGPERGPPLKTLRGPPFAVA